jgi:glutamate formiminotransferase/formiminotetrahydrofolate cyclodeaminase
VVGLIPYQAMVEAGRYYLRRQGKTAGVPARDVLNAAVFSLGLSDVAPFEVEKKVIGLPENAGALVALSVRDFTDEVSRDTPAPGGGSIAALAGALGAALASMVANLTHGKEGTEDRDAALADLAERAQRVKDALLAAVDEDTNAFNAYLEARRLPQATEEERALRERKMQEGLKEAAAVPWRTAEASFEAMQIAREVAALGKPDSVTDAGVGVQIAFAGVQGAVWNVLVNLQDLEDAAFTAEMRARCADLLGRARALLAETEGFVAERIGSSR